jgi:uncharacterized membrane protein
MDISKIFGAFLSVIGIVFLIYTAFLIVGDADNLKKLIVFGILGSIFFFSGISLQKTPPK